MSRDDWIGLGASLGVHLLLLLLFAFVVAGRTPPQALGAVQVEIGAFTQGQPVKKVQAPAKPKQERPPSPAEAPSQEKPAPQESAPVDLPEQEPPPQGKDPPPEETPTKPEPDAPPVEEPSEAADEQPEPAPEEASEDAAPEQREASEAETSAEGGAREGSTTGADEGTEGTGEEQEKAAPYDIEGLNRTRLRGALPQYTEKVNAVIKVEITVDPQGRVIGRRLLRKANPSLERSVLDAVQRWRFNPLPRNAPQENQTGVVTFRFRLE